MNIILFLKSDIHSDRIANAPEGGVFINFVVFILSKTSINSNVPSLLLSYVVLSIISITDISATLGSLW